MRYSVYDPATGGYHYYDGPGELEGGVFAPAPRLRSTRNVGLAPEEAARPLPAGAVPAGHGPLPQGVIATRKPLGGAILFGFDLGTLALLGLGGYLGYKYLKKR